MSATVPDVVIRKSKLAGMNSRRRALLREYLQEHELVGRRVSEIRRTVQLRFGDREIAAHLIRALEEAVLQECGPRRVFTGGRIVELRDRPIKCPVKGCECTGSITWHRRLAR